MASNLKAGTVWTPPTYTDDGSQDASNQHVSAQKMNAMTAEISSVQRFAVNNAVVANVRDYGAKGDTTHDGVGGTDDTAAIQAACDSGASIVYVPRGYYKITDTINLGSGGYFQTKMIGDPAGLASGTGAASLVWGGTNRRSTPGSAMVNVNYRFGGGIHHMGFWNGGRTYYHIHVYNSEGDAWVEDSHHSHMSFFGDSYACIRASKNHHTHITDSYCDNIGGYFYEGENCNGIRIINCTTFFRESAGIRFYGSATADHANNSILNCWNWLSGGCAHFLSGNELKTGAAVILEDQRGFNIVGNQFAANAGGIRAIGCDGVNISGNVFDFHQLDTIDIQGSANINITGNTFTANDHTMDDYGHYTLKTSGTCSRVAFTNNVDRDTHSVGVLLQSGTTHSLVDNYMKVNKTVTNQGGETNVVGRLVG